MHFHCGPCDCSETTSKPALKWGKKTKKNIGTGTNLGGHLMVISMLSCYGSAYVLLQNANSSAAQLQ
jgi:hypothetical protein